MPVKFQYNLFGSLSILWKTLIEISHLACETLEYLVHLTIYGYATLQRIREHLSRCNTPTVYGKYCWGGWNAISAPIGTQLWSALVQIDSGHSPIINRNEFSTAASTTRSRCFWVSGLGRRRRRLVLVYQHSGFGHCCRFGGLILGQLIKLLSVFS